MKSGLRACLSPLFTSEHGVVSVSAKLRCLEFISTRAAFYVRTSADFQLEGIQSLKRSFHRSSDEDDDFSELGSPVVQGVGTRRKLKTEKPEPFRKNEPRRRSSSGISLAAQGSPRLKDISSKLGNSSPGLSLKLDNQDNISINPTNINASNFKSSSSVSIENVPSTIDLSHLEEALSVFGKISKASITSKPNELDCCYAQFESVECCKRAISAGEIIVKSFLLRIRPLLVQETVTIRISNISSETAYSAIHSMCMSYGALEGLVRTKEGVLVALFGVKDNSDTHSILKKLNYTIMDDCKWKAFLCSREPVSEVMTTNDDNGYNLWLQIGSHLADFERQMSMKKVYREDLGRLLQALMHLEAHPAVRREVPNSD